MITLVSTQPAIPAPPVPTRDLDPGYGCVEWYLYPEPAADALKPLLMATLPRTGEEQNSRAATASDV